MGAINYREIVLFINFRLMKLRQIDRKLKKLLLSSLIQQHND